MPRSRRALSRRSDGQVFPLELFFDLVFVYGITQCSGIMSQDPTWTGIGHGLLVLVMLWWAWTAYAWLTSVVDPEQDLTRMVMFAAMAAVLVAAVCVPRAFGDLALTFAVAYAAVRLVQIVLFVLVSPDDPDLRRSVGALAASSGIAVLLLLLAAVAHPTIQAGLWALAVLADLGGPFLFGSAGWKLVPDHFAERHGAVVIIALGESIVAVGAGITSVGITAATIALALVGLFLAAGMWWLYFDVAALASERRLAAMEPGQPQNALARDAYSYLHLALVAGIVLAALGTRSALGAWRRPLDVELAATLAGGVALYLWGHVAFRWRFVRSVNRERLAVGVLLVLLVPAAPLIPAWALLGVVAAVVWALVVYETTAWSDTRGSIRSGHLPPGPDDPTATPTEEHPD